MKIISFLIAFTFFTHAAYSASCCGGSSALPTLITADDKAIFNIGVSHSKVMADVNNQVVFRTDQNNETKQTYSFSGAYQFSEYAQIGGGFNIQSKQREVVTGQEESSSGLGDLFLNSAYEFMPEFYYSKYKPRGLVFLELTLPTARSIHDHQKRLNTDARGSGFYTASPGLLFLKAYRTYDYLVAPKVTFYNPRTFETSSGEEVKISPKPTYQLLTGLGYNLAKSPTRFGASLAYTYKGGKSGEYSANNEYYFDLSLSASYMFASKISTSLTYSDQTIFGPVKNTTLSRTIAFSLQKKFPL